MSRLTRMAITMCCLTLLLAGAPAMASANPNRATVTTEVYGSDGIPIDGAHVELSVLRGQTYRSLSDLTTDEYGEAEYELMPAAYKLDVSAPGADPSTTYLTTERSQTYELEITLQSYGSAAGTIYDQATGLPLAGATVDLFLREADGSWPDDPTVSVLAADGTYSAEDVPAGEYRIRASAPGYRSAFYDGYGLGTPTPVVYRDSEVTGIDIFLTPLAQSGVITGRVVTGASETPVPGAFVFIYRQNDDGTWPATSPGWGEPTRTVCSDPLGAYTSEELPLGAYRVRFFTVHLGSQWWEYVPTVDLATVVNLTEPGQAIGGIDGWFGKP